MVAHATLVKQLIADEQMALEDRALVLGEGRAGDREAARGQVRHPVEQRVGHRADVAGGRGIEGRAVLEVDLLHTLRPQPAQRSQRLRHRIGWCDGARLQCDDNRVGVNGCRSVVRHADRLHRAHAAAHKIVGQVGGAGEIVGDAAEQR